MTGIKHNVRKKITCYSQFNSNSNKISLFILKNLTLASDKNLILSLKIKKTISSVMMISHQIVCISLSLAAPLEPFTHRQNVASLSLFYRYYFDRCSSELDELIPLPPSRSESYRYSNRSHDYFLSPFLYVIRMSMLTISFLARLGCGILCLQNAFIWPVI